MSSPVLTLLNLFSHSLIPLFPFHPFLPLFLSSSCCLFLITLSLSSFFFHSILLLFPLTSHFPLQCPIFCLSSLLLHQASPFSSHVPSLCSFMSLWRAIRDHGKDDVIWMRLSQRHQTASRASQKAEGPTSHAEKRLETLFVVPFYPSSLSATPSLHCFLLFLYICSSVCGLSPVCLFLFENSHKCDCFAFCRECETAARVKCWYCHSYIWSPHYVSICTHIYFINIKPLCFSSFME